MAEGVWKLNFGIRLKVAIRYFKKSYSVSEYHLHIDDFESRWKPKAMTGTEKRLLQREIEKLRNNENNK